ncbi:MULTISPECIES: hypothetical protein [unclassified Microbacterium]|uniref:hypothetical protein n=1 Tax=unclassified Microbacterium TaxID=2609290 RepID=UPI000EAAA25E|nr:MULTISPECIES: hypothetical protein [unclassified Microbacterium]MBT2484807.1 hypothetical protein [Microbacterium sp. ISL-108]RKN67680.1 hypothetical protein D7252_08835 [Microbacterium sp. CGR2]
MSTNADLIARFDSWAAMPQTGSLNQQQRWRSFATELRDALESVENASQSPEREEAYRVLSEHAAAHLDVALSDSNQSQAEGSLALMESVNILHHGRRTRA